MTFKQIKLLLTGSALLMTAAVAQAMPAKRGWTTFVQPDGTEIKVQQHGDERFHYTVTEDDNVVVNENGCLYFARVGEEGAFVSTGIKAAPAGMLSESARAFISENKAADLVTRAKTAREASKVFKAPMHRLPDNMLTEDFPSTGEQPILVVLVEYQDVKFTNPDPQAYFSRMLNEEGFSLDNGTGSARDYFIQSSAGKFKPRFDVSRPVTLKNNMRYYGGNLLGNDAKPEEMAIEACQALDDEIDFTLYDCNNDGLIDNVFVLYAGYGEADNVDKPDTVWPHAYWIYKGAGKTYYLDGKLLDHYACSNELNNAGAYTGISTFCHEFSHVMGLPDLYTTDGSNQHTPGEWDVLDYGCYLNDGRTPPIYSAFERLSLKWIDPIEIKQATDLMVPNLNDNVAFMIPTDNDNEFFLIENRQQSGWDRFIPGHGMLVWHITYDSRYWIANSVNNYTQLVDIIEAGGSLFSSPYTKPSGADPFPGTRKKTSFTASTDPAFKSNSGVATGFSFTEIAETDGIITLKVNDGAKRPDAPVILPVTEKSGRAFKAEWNAVEGAVEYLVTLREKETGRLIINHASNGTANTFNATGLTPETVYEFSVMAVANSCVSDESKAVEVATTTPLFTELIVEATDATDVTDKSFTANWEALPTASSYELTVWSEAPTVPFKQTASYMGKKLPEGWTSQGIGSYTITSNCGNASPSIRFNVPGDYVQTCTYDGDVTLLTFWLKGVNNGSALNNITISGLNSSDAWEKIRDEYITNSPRTVSFSIDRGYRAIRIEYTGSMTTNVPVAIDDIEVSGNKLGEIRNVIDAVNVGNVTSYSVKDLDNSLVYHYTVRGTDGNEFTMSSPVIDVNLADMSSIDSIVTDKDGITVTGGDVITIIGTDETATVYNIQGNIVYTGARRSIQLPAGFYIVKVADTVAKVVIN